MKKRSDFRASPLRGERKARPPPFPQKANITSPPEVRTFHFEPPYWLKMESSHRPIPAFLCAAFFSLRTEPAFQAVPVFRPAYFP